MAAGRARARGFPALAPLPSIVPSVTEIPEHLLKRSQAARAKSGGDAPADAPAPAATPAVAAAAAPAAVAKAAAPAPAAPVAKPDSPVVAAYRARKKTPVWAMLGLSILPVWGFMYVRALTPQKVEAQGPLGAGAKTYTAACAGCHGGAGEGGVGYAFTEKSIIKTFPHIEDQLRFVYFGTDNYIAAGVDVYGDPNREGGPHIAGAKGKMPPQGGSLSDVEILNVVCHERYTLGGMEEGEEFEKWCSETSEIHAALASGSSTLANLHETFDDIIPIGDVPVAGSPAAEG